MKKILISLTLAVVLLFTVGCSCSEAATLTFKKLWTDQGNGYKETLTYDVNYVDDYSENGYSFKKSSDLIDLHPTITGTYVVTTEIMSKSSTNLPDQVKNAGSFDLIGSSIIKTTAELTLNTRYEIGTTVETKDEYINVVSYSADVDWSLAPIYVSREFRFFNPYVNPSNKTITLSELSGTDVTIYSGDSYSVVKDYGDKHDEKTYEYAMKTVLDNSSLLFATRNKDITKNNDSYAIPVVAPAYGAAQTLNLKTFAQDEFDITLNYFGEDKTLKFPVRGISFVVNSVNASGTSQICYVQSDKPTGSDDKNNSLLIKYVEPISNYNGYTRIGALVYQLAKVESAMA